MPPTGWNMVAWKSNPSSNIAADAGQIAGARQGPVSRARRSLELQVGRKIAVGAQERNHALLVVGSQFLIECTAVKRLAEQFSDFAAHVVVCLAHFDRPAAIGLRIVDERTAVGIDQNFEGNAQFTAIPECRLMCARNSRRTGVPVKLGVEIAKLARAVGSLVPRRIDQLRPPTPSRA